MILALARKMVRNGQQIHIAACLPWLLSTLETLSRKGGHKKMLWQEATGARSLTVPS